MPNAKPFPLYTDGTNIYTSFDGGATFITISSGDGGTIHTSTPLSGDGSVGTPATIANGAITNAKLATPPQDPAAVAITGGSIVGVNLATRSVQGAMAPADKAFLDDFTGWQKTMYATAIAAVPGLTGFQAFPVTIVTPGVAAAANFAATALDAGIEGGGLTASGGAFVLGAPVFQNLPGGNYAWGFRGKFAAAVSANLGYCGVAWNNSSHLAREWIGANYTTSTTNFSYDFRTEATDNAVALSAPFDTSWHNWLFTDNGTTITVWQDGISVGTTSTRTTVPVANPMTPLCYSSSTGQSIISAWWSGYVRP